MQYSTANNGNIKYKVILASALIYTNAKTHKETKKFKREREREKAKIN